MPELPEVETLRRYLQTTDCPGSAVRRVRVLWGRSIEEPDAQAFGKQLEGDRICGIDRRGKYLVFGLASGSTLLVHLRMTGGFRFFPGEHGPDRHDRVLFELESGVLVFHDTRKFGRLRLTRNPEAILDRLGPEPLSDEFLPSPFFDSLRRRRRLLKPLLLDQSFLAGLGNIYVDESLFASGLHPKRRSDSLSRIEADRLYAAIRRTLEQGIENGGTSLGDGETNFSSGGIYGRNASALQIFRRTGEPCPRCGTPVERIIVAQRSSHLCPRCQIL